MARIQKPVDPIASALAKRRWANVPDTARKAAGRHAVKAREQHRIAQMSPDELAAYTVRVAKLRAARRTKRQP